MGAPWAGGQGASEAAVFSILPELATQRDGPRRPGESEILFERCSKGGTASSTWAYPGIAQLLSEYTGATQDSEADAVWLKQAESLCKGALQQFQLSWMAIFSNRSSLAF